jgi:hypothetical protein
MAKQGLRIYVYKITFEEVLHYYYGLHKEKRFDEYYMGSPVTHKDFWELYTPKKEYIEFFEYSDEGYTEARIFEDSLIAPVYNTDPLCLNEHCGGFYSLESCRKAGQIGGKITYKKGIGVHALTTEERIQIGKNNYTQGVGIHGMSREERIENSKKGGKIAGNKNKENKTGVCGQSLEKMRENGKKGGPKGGKTSYEKGSGIYGRSKEQHSEDSRKAGKTSYEKGVGFHAFSKEERIEVGKEVSSQKWQCTETGYISTAGGLTYYQKARGIDTSKRIKVDSPRAWEITFEDGKVIVTYQTLKDWAKENGYSYYCLLNVRKCRVKNHKGIIKVVPF